MKESWVGDPGYRSYCDLSALPDHRYIDRLHDVLSSSCPPLAVQRDGNNTVTGVSGYYEQFKIHKRSPFLRSG